MRPMGAFESARAEHQRADARADREHRQLQTEEGLKSHGFHGGGNGHVEGREAHIEHDEHSEQRQYAGIEQYALGLGAAAFELAQGQLVGIFACSGAAVIVRDHGDLFHDDRRLGGFQREEYGAADTACHGGHEQLGYRMHGGGQPSRQNRPQNKDDLVNGGFHGVGRVEQLFTIFHTAQRIGPAGSDQCTE